MRSVWPFCLALTLSVAAAFVAPGGGIALPPHRPHRTLESGRPITSLRAAVPGVVSGRNLAVAGRIPWEKLLLTKAQARQIVKIMRAETVRVSVARFWPCYISRVLV